MRLEVPLRRLRYFLILACLLLSAIKVSAQPETIVGLWRSGNDPVSLHRLNSWEAFVDKWKELGPMNQRLVDVEVLKVGGVTQYTGVWRYGKDNHALHQLPTWESFVDMWQKLGKQNLRLVDLEVVKNGDQLSYIGVWREGNDAHGLYQLNTWNAFVDKWKELAAKKLHLINIEAVPVGNEVHYIGVWRAGQEGNLFYANSYGDFSAKWRELGKQNQRLVDVEMVRSGSEIHYIGVWHAGQDQHGLFQAESWKEFVDKWKEFNDQSLRLTDIAVAELPGKPIPKPKGKPLGLVFDGKPLKKDPVSGLEFPSDMPAINYPEFVGCREDDKKVVQKAWANAHFSVWRAYQFIEYIASRNDKDELWRWGYVEGDDQFNYSPRAWFGSFEDSRFRFQMIHEVVSKLWNDRFLGKKYNFKVKCREQDKDGPHPCYLKDDNGEFKYSANHIVLGTINFCPVFFSFTHDEDRTRTVVHEMLHWLSAQGLYVSDTHTHSDIVKGLCRTKTEKIYGWKDAMELAESDGCLGSSRIHREIATRSNDNYAYFIQRLGSRILSNKLTSFPSGDYFKTH